MNTYIFLCFLKYTYSVLFLKYTNTYMFSIVPHYKKSKIRKLTLLCEYKKNLKSSYSHQK